ncbi:Cytochrome P450 2U1 [Halotydeus destructor]|nr:Cytochrome P450 2U1 [Halotydeus destructor]
MAAMFFGGSWSIDTEYSTSHQVGLLIFISAISYLVYYIADFYARVSQLPPGPTPLPYFGNILLLTRGRSLHNVFIELSKKHGKLFTFWIGKFAFINIGDTDIANEAFIKKMADFAGRPFIPGTEGMLSDKGADITFTDYGRDWEVLRRATFSAIRKYTITDQFAKRVTEAIDETVDEYQSKHGDQPFRASDFLYVMTYKIMWQSVLSRHFTSDDETLHRLVAGSRRLMKAQWKLPIVQCVQWLKYLPGFREDFQAIMKHQRFQRHLCEKILEEHLATYREGQVRDLIDAILASKQETEAASPSARRFSIHDLAGILMDTVAGSDNLRQSLQWALLHLANFPDVQTRIRREVEDLVGDADANLDNCANLNYTKSFIAESLRYRNVNPLGFAHMATVDSTLAGYPVKKGTCIFLHQHAIMNDSDHWDKPDQFKPERFLDSNGQHISHVASFVPFSTGRRTCVGEKLVLAEMLFWTVRIVQRTRGQRIELEHGPGSVSLDGDNGVNVFLIPVEHRVVVRRI